MSQVGAGTEAVAAALVGSLSNFSLIDVLELLGRTDRSGELQVVGRGTDKRVWIDRGDLIDTTGADPQGATLFELACIDDGWFYFTVAERVPDATSRMPLASLLADLGPQVQEWRSLVEELPFVAMVSMSTSTPADEVQIRSDQWQLLSLVGAGHSVREIVDGSALHPLDTLRTLRELRAAGLVSLEQAGPSSGASPAGMPTTLSAPPAPDGPVGTPVHAGAESGAGQPFGAPGSTGTNSADGDPASSDFPSRLPLPPFTPPATPAEPTPPPPPPPAASPPLPPPPVASPPPPPPSPPYAVSSSDEATSTALPPFQVPSQTPPSEPPGEPSPVTPPEAPAEGPTDSPATATVATSEEGTGEAAGSASGDDSDAQPSVMPPPITGDPWSTSHPAEPATGDGAT